MYLRRHALTFSCIESGMDFGHQSAGTIAPSSSQLAPLSPSSSLSSLTSSPASQTPSLEADDDASSAASDSSDSMHLDHPTSSPQSEERRWTGPRATFDFSAKDVPFPIDIEVPFESFRTVLWSVYMKRKNAHHPQVNSTVVRIANPDYDDEIEGQTRPSSPAYSYSYNSLITKGLERVSQFGCFMHFLREERALSD